ncbi:MAG: hypothetical protein MJ247_04005 [Alphaproteobacteria bacterium]|nr:hypothetical protein [Alphaproteobacteria bacterium]
MTMYEDFMAKGPIRSFQAGGRPVVMSNEDKSLNAVFAKKSKTKSDASPERMEKLKGMLKKTKIGRETLAFLDEKGSGLGFEEMPYYGYFSPDENRVAISPKYSDEDLAITLVHEIRHARQDSIMTNTSPDMVPGTLLKNGFLIEADACAAECVLAHEMLEMGDRSIFEAHQKTAYAPMSTAFEKEFDKSHDWDKARSAALMEWVNLPVKPGYANQYIDFMSEIVKDGDPQYFQHSMDIKKMAEKLCINSKGECYVQNPKLLEDAEHLNVNEKQAKKIVSMMLPYTRKTGRGYEKLELDKIHVSHEDGTYTTIAQEMKLAKSRNNAQAVSKAAKGRQGR